MKKVIIDCDPGVDDALALVLAVTKPCLDILAITTVMGNVSGDRTIRNAKLLLNSLNSTIPLAKGAMKPLVKDHVFTNVHGEDGLANLSDQLESDNYPFYTNNNAVELMSEILDESSEPITIIALGPLTNIATLLNEYPDLKPKIKEISIMGGGIGVGNVTDYAEFNVFVDPEACEVVLNSNVPIVMATLNSTLQANLLEEDVKKFEILSTPLAKFLHKIMLSYAKFDSALHDPVSVLWVSNPELFQTKSVHLQVHTQDDSNRGKTYIIEGKKPNIQYITSLNRELIINEILNSFKMIKDLS
ncbi:MAG: nucleoside hydrolase [Erysipelothrix sp.]|nr:nucleoside hydrolase [Erysipelothrix sp.]